MRRALGASAVILAVMLIRWLFGRRITKRLRYALWLFVPVYLGVSLFVRIHDSAPQYASALMSVFSEARQDVESSIEDMLNNNEDPQEAVDKLAKEINKAISDYNVVNS